MLKRAAVLAVVAAFVLAGCGGPGSDATFDPDAPGADGANTEATSDTDGNSRPVVRGREDPTEREEADLDESAQRACDRAITGSGRYSQAGYDRGVAEGVEAGLDEDELVAAIEATCGDEIAEARGD
jgi:hypothetical protein